MTEAQTETQTTRPPAEDLSFLTTVKTKKAKLGVTSRGRQPQENPCAGHYAASLEKLDEDGNGEVLCLPAKAKHATRIEGYLRKAAMEENYGITVQVKYDPKGDETIPLTRVKDLEPELDVFVTYQAREKAQTKASANGHIEGQTEFGTE